jgi:DNA repair exonuclease SbcCD ATPase subunit
MTPKIVVRIKNFRTYTINPDREDGFYEFNFEQGVNLLKGASGAGKSTVFSAISWCLFKKPSTGNTPLYGGTKETVVSMVIENRYLITRTSPKSIFTVTNLIREETLENEEAQIFIYQQWGKEHVWKTCNYVSQGSINNLINGELTDAQRWEVLYTLAFETGLQRDNVNLEDLKTELRTRVDTMNRKYEVIQNELQRRESTIQSYQGELETLLQTLGEDHSFFHLDDDMVRKLVDQARGMGTEMVTSEMIESCQERLSSLTLSVKEIESQLKTLEDSKSMLTGERIQRETKDKEFLKSIVKEISQKKSQVEDNKKWLDRAEHLQTLLGSLMDEYPEVKRWPANELITRLNKFLPKLQWLQNRDSWREIVQQGSETRIEEEIYQEEISNKHQQLELEKTKLETIILKSLPQLSSVEGEWLPTLDYDDPDQTGTKVLMDCPCCSKKLSILLRQGGSQVESVREYRGEISLTKKMTQMISDRDKLVKKLSELPPLGKVSGRGLNTLLKMKSDIQTWMSIPEGLRNLLVQTVERRKVSGQVISELSSFESFDVEKISERRVYQESLEAEVAHLMVTRDMITVSLSLIDNEFSGKIQSITDTMMTLMKELTNLSRETPLWEQKLARLQREYDWWTTIQRYGLETKDQFLEKVEVRKVRGKTQSKIIDVETRLKDLVSQQELAMRDSQTTASQLKLVVELQSDLETVESKVLSECVDRVSHLTNSFLDNAFDNPIMVNLVTEKETKGGKGKKHAVGISIKAGKPGLPNLVERSLDGFSGGETDRISLGFSSAITTFSPFPLLMLDECISSLDTEMKDKVIRALRQQAKMTNKAVVLICHDAVDGLFDHVAEVM